MLEEEFKEKDKKREILSIRRENIKRTIHGKILSRKVLRIQNGDSDAEGGLEF